MSLQQFVREIYLIQLITPNSLEQTPLLLLVIYKVLNGLSIIYSGKRLLC